MPPKALTPFLQFLVLYDKSTTEPQHIEVMEFEPKLAATTTTPSTFLSSFMRGLRLHSRRVAASQSLVDDHARLTSLLHRSATCNAAGCSVGLDVFRPADVSS